MRRAAFVNEGTTNNGFEAWICASVCPAANPCTNDVLAPAASDA